MQKIDEIIPGGVGPLMDELPTLTNAQVRPYVIATLLHRGAVKSEEITACLVSHCNSSDLKVGDWDPVDSEWCESTRLEKIVDEVFGELVAEGTVRYNEELNLWVLTSQNISKIISWVAALGARMPQHLLMELSREQIKRIPEYIDLEGYCL
jgi:hypothetical protein